MFKEGTKVAYVGSPKWHELAPEYYPEVGTVGVVIYASSRVTEAYQCRFPTTTMNGWFNHSELKEDLNESNKNLL